MSQEVNDLLNKKITFLLTDGTTVIGRLIKENVDTVDMESFEERPANNFRIRKSNIVYYKYE
ncbi:MAG: hypothetical protein AABY32_00850 [Nanoarchaeota archaeon]